MADLSTKQLRVLTHALALVRFTLPELSAVSGVSYETAKKVLKAEEGKTVERTGGETRPGVGRPANIWTVIDPAAIAERLEGPRRELQGIERSAASGADERDEEDTQLAVGEDYLLFALSALDADDARAFASDALTALGDDLPGMEVAVDPGEALLPDRARRNVPSAVARATIVRALATYLRSDEAKGIGGPFWRTAFRAIALVDVPDHDALHKTLLVDLVRLADERSGLAERVREASTGELAELILPDGAGSDGAAAADALVRAASTGSAAGREALRGAVALLLAEFVAGARELRPAWVVRTLSFTAQLFAPGSETQPAVLEGLVESLCELAQSTDPALAVPAQETLIAISQPRRRTYWLELAQSAPVPPPLRLVFQGIVQTNVLEAFSYLRRQLDAGAPEDEVLNGLVETLPALDVRAENARERFADFLAAITNRSLRNHLAAAPLLAGLDWPIPSLERRQMRELMSTLRRWTTLRRSGHDDVRVMAEEEVLAARIEDLAEEIFPLLTGEDERRVCDALTTELESREGAKLAVRTLLAVGREDQLARRIVRNAARDDELLHKVAEWYLEVAPRDSMDEAQRTALVNALTAALPRDHEDSFFYLLITSGEVLPEVFDNAALAVSFYMNLERRTDFRLESAVALEEIAEAPEYMM